MIFEIQELFRYPSFFELGALVKLSMSRVTLRNARSKASVLIIAFQMLLRSKHACPSNQLSLLRGATFSHNLYTQYSHKPHPKTSQ